VQVQDKKWRFNMIILLITFLIVYYSSVFGVASAEYSLPTKREFWLRMIPFYMWYTGFVDYYNKLEE